MSRRTLLNKYQLLSLADSTAVQTAIQTDVSGVDFATYQIGVGAAVNAIASIKFCNDVVITPDSVFVALEFGLPLSLIGATDTNYLVTVENQGFRWLQLSTVNNGGTGTVSAWVTGIVRGS